MASRADEFNTALFMEEVQKYECLYNKYSKDYKNKFIRLNCLNAIGKKFGITGEEADKKYKNIRTGYGRWLKKAKNVPSGSGRDAVPKPPPEYENLDWLASHIRHQHVPISNLLSQGSDNEDDENTQSESVAVIDEQASSQVPDAESPDSGSVNENLSSSARSSSSSPVEAVPIIREVTKKKRAWSNQKSSQVKHARTQELDIDMELLRTAKSIADGLLGGGQDTTPEVENEDTLYCKSLATRMRSLDHQRKAYVRMQIEQLLFNVEYAVQGLNPSFSGQNANYSQGPHYAPNGQNVNYAQEPSVPGFPQSVDPYHLQN